MFFKNLMIYTLNFPTLTAEMLEEALDSNRAKECGRTDLATYGFVSPFDGSPDGLLVHAAEGHLMVVAQEERKILPSSVVNEAVSKRVAVIEQAQQRKVYRKERDTLKDEVLIDLLPRAFTRKSKTAAVLSPRHGYLIVNTASSSKAEELMSALREALGTLPVTLLHCKDRPADVMTRWLTDGAPNGFGIARACELVNPLDPAGLVRCKAIDLDSQEILQHLEAGMQVSQLAMTYRDELEFTMTDDLAFKRVTFSDLLIESLHDDEADEAAEKDATLVLMMGTLMSFISDVLASLGGKETILPKTQPVGDAHLQIDAFEGAA